MTTDSSHQQSADSQPDRIRENRNAADAPAQHFSAASRVRVSGVTLTLARVLMALILLFNAVWIGGFWVLNRNAQIPPVQANLSLHMTRIEQLLSQPNRTAPATLNSLASEFQAATTDLQQLNGLLPLGGEWPFGTVTTEHHLLQLAMDTTQASQNIITAVPLLQPIQDRVTQSLINAGAPPNVGGNGQLTLQEINQAQFYIDTARIYWQEAQQERTQLTPAAVAALHEPEASAFLAQYDQFSPMLSTGLELTSSLLDWSPLFLGVTAPDHFLLLVVDPSDLRSGGGRVWDYAELVTNKGTLFSGISFHSVQSLDCPQVSCGVQSIPPGYEWFPLNRSKFGLADAILDPSLDQAAPIIKRIYQLESGEQLDGVIVMTPGLYADLLRVTGPVTLPGSESLVTATNVEALLIAEHEKLPATGAVRRGTTPDIEMLLTKAILERIAGANLNLQGKLSEALTGAIQSKDLSFYSNSPRVEAMLAQLGMAGEIATPTGDTWLVSDTNVGLAANNPLVAESIADRVTFDARGNATHTLTITYKYDANAYWSGTRPLLPYSDFVRVIAPKGASLPHISGPCAQVALTLDNFSTAGCQLTVNPGATIRIYVTWLTPAKIAISGERYSLLVQRQPGANDAVTLSLVAPSGFAFSHPGANPGMSLRQSGHTLMWAASSLTRDTLISAILSPSQG